MLLTIRKVDQLNSDGNMYPPNKPKPNVGQLGLTKNSYVDLKNDAWLLVRGLVKRPGKARPNRLSNSTPEFHQTTYQKPYPIRGRVKESLLTLLTVPVPSRFIL